MARKTNWTGYALVAGLVALGVKFHQEISDQWNSLTAKK